MKRFLGVLVALAALGAAAASVGSIDLRRDIRAQTEASRAADQALAKLDDALETHLRAAEPRVAAAASRPELMKVLAILRQADDPETIVPTLTDAFSRESYWEPFRRDFPLNIISLSEGAPELIVGAKQVDATAFTATVRAQGLSSGVLAIDGTPWVAAGERISLPARKVPVVLVLAAPLRNDALEQIARRASGAVMVSNGKESLGVAGADQATAQMASLVGREKQAAPVTSATGEWAAGCRQLVPGLWLWVYANAHASAAEAAQAATVNKTALWAGAGLLALLSLFIAFRRATPVTTQSANLDLAPTFTTPGMGRADRTTAAVGPNASATAAGPPIDKDAPFPYAATAALASATTTGSSRVFGRYTIVAMLGEGGMAQVFTAITAGAEGFRRRFVVKRLRPELANEATVVAQFIDEAKLGSLMVHSNIIPVFDFGRVGDEYYLATEYILGRDLGITVAKSVQVQGKPLSVAVILHVVAETLKALHYAHNRRGDDGRALSVVHRDVSPSNILISAGGEVKLFDFGIVKAEGRVTQTQQGVVKGNVSFMSPEQARGMPVDGRADLFSLGLVMYYAATGQTLYQGGTAYELLVCAATGPNEEARAKIAALPAPLDTLVAKALEVTADNRYENALEFLRVVEQHLRNHPVNLGHLVQQLFSAEFADEERRFSAALPADVSSRSSSSQRAIAADGKTNPS